MTDVTGFGLGGHLLEMCKASNMSAQINFDALPLIHDSIHDYINKGCVPGCTHRNYDSYGSEIEFSSPAERFIICDPQTSGGLLIAVQENVAAEVASILHTANLISKPIGKMKERSDRWIEIH